MYKCHEWQEKKEVDVRKLLYKLKRPTFGDRQSPTTLTTHTAE